MREVSHPDRTRELFQRFGYDPDDPVPRSEDGERVIPDRLMDAIATAPLLSERNISRITSMRGARLVANAHLWRSYLRKRRQGVRVNVS